MRKRFLIKTLRDFYEKFSKIRELEKCRTCICFYEMLKLFDDEVGRLGKEKPKGALDSTRWWEEKEKVGIHDCLGCDPCLPFEAYSEFQTSSRKKAYCLVCGEEIE